MRITLSFPSTRPCAVLMLVLTLILALACSTKEMDIPDDMEMDIPDDMVLVPEGTFIFGSNDMEKVKTQDKGEYKMLKPLYADEYPEQTVSLEAFLIDKYEVTNSQFRSFRKSSYPPGKENHPALNISWYDADNYCTSIHRRLPTAREWEKAARGPKGNIYPWGQEFVREYANTGKSGIKDTTPVGVFEKGKSYYGVYDMIGNTSEWTADWYKPYAGSTYESPDFGEKKKEIRGSSWGGLGHYKLGAFDRASHRRMAEPDRAVADVGFRCAKSVQ